ncbi:MAG: hypothetical protein HEQ19_06765 [Gloeotrichia echinulata CP02]
MGIALLVRTLRERLRSVTRDWGLWIGLIYSLLITHYSLLLTIGDWGLVSIPHTPSPKIPIRGWSFLSEKENVCYSEPWQNSSTQEARLRA